jgi:hypothetical protein
VRHGDSFGKEILLIAAETETLARAKNYKQNALEIDQFIYSLSEWDLSHAALPKILRQHLTSA